jgi:hypothetical protein
VSGSIGVFIYSHKQFRTFIESGAFESIENEYLLTYFIESAVAKSLSEELPNNSRVYLGHSSFLHRSGTFLATLKLWENRLASPAHTFRALASFGSRVQRKKANSMILYNMEGWSESKRLLIRILGKEFLINVLRKFRNFLLIRIFNRKFQDEFLTQLDAVFIPYSGLLTSEFDDLITYFSTKSIETIAIQENWDNLSSKTFVGSAPDHFFLWGDQSKGHMNVIHNLRNTTPHVVGSPRFLPYFSRQAIQSGELSEMLDGRRYILFTGTGDGIDDYFILDATMRALTNYQIKNSINLVYRPHPFTRNPVDAQAMDSFLQSGVLVDQGTDRKSVFYHCSLILNAELVINQFSTMLLEALSCDRKVLLPTFVGRPVKYDYSEAINEWHHFIGLAAFPNVHLAHDLEGYEKVLLEAINAEFEVSSKSASWMCSSVDSRVEFLAALKNIVK